MTPKEKKMPGKRGNGRLVWLLIALGLLAAVAGVSAKYAQTKTDVKDTVAEDFYFTSTMLTSDEKGVSYTLMPTTTELEIPLCNYADSLRYATADITYSYTVTKDNTEVTHGNGTLSGKQLTTDYISLTNLTKGTYTVTATAARPFAATLTGSFTIPEESGGVKYSVSDSAGSPFATLTVWTTNYSGNIQITWPAGVIPDSTDPALAGVITNSGSSYGAGSLTVTSSTYESNTYRFFKTDPSAIYSNANFTAAKVGQ